MAESTNKNAELCVEHGLRPVELEKDMQEILPVGDDHENLRLSDSDFDTISSLLTQANRQDWSFRPRTYAILRSINALDLMEDFVQLECLDIALPYSEENLPRSLSLKHRSYQRDQFLKRQGSVLSQEAAKVENRSKGHVHFAKSADDHFTSLGMLGQGGSGSVDRIRSKLSRKIFVRKRLDRQKTFEQSEQALKYFKREVDALRRLNHHHLVRYIGSYTDPQFVGIIMLPVADSDLRAFLDKKSFHPAEYDCIREAFGCLCAAVMYLTKAQVRHKDIKPENILIRQRRVYLTDFGICRDWLELTRSTTAGEVGPISIAYAAPEVVAKDPRSTSADIWSLGCVYFDMITILKYETLPSKLSYFQNHGTYGEYPRNNMEAFKGWIEKLQSKPESKEDNAPLEWIKDMVRERRTSRISSEQLMSRIHDECGEQRDFYGTCCRENNEDELPSRLKESEDCSTSEDLSDNQVSEKKRPDPAVVEKRLCNAASAQDLPTLERSLRRAHRLQQPCLNTHAIHIAASKGYEDILAILIGFGCNLEFKSDNRTPLFKAVENSHEGTTNRLIQAKVILDTKNSSKSCTALHLAVQNDFHAGVQALLKADASPDICDQREHTPLISAASAGCLHCVGLLLRNGAKVALGDRNQVTALHVAAREGHARTVKTLLEHGAVISLKSKFGRSAIHLASQEGHNGVILELLVRGADINEYDDDLDWGCTPLLTAVMFQRPETVQLLLDQGADVNLPTKGVQQPNRTPIYCAIQLNQQKIVKSLLSFKPDLERQDSRVSTPLILATREGKMDIIQLLLEAGVSTENRQGVGTHTAFTYSLWCLKGFQIAQVLIDHKANINDPNIQGRTSLHEGAREGRLDIVEFLLNAGADIDQQDKAGLTALIYSAYCRQVAVLEKLIAYGPSVNLQDDNGNTALHCAVFADSEEITSLLLRNGAEPLIINKDGLNTMGLALKHGRAAILVLLARALADAGRMIADPRWPGVRIFLTLDHLENGYDIQSRDGFPLVFSLQKGRLTDTGPGIYPPWLDTRKVSLPAELEAQSPSSPSSRFYSSEKNIGSRKSPFSMKQVNDLKKRVTHRMRKTISIK